MLTNEQIFISEELAAQEIERWEKEISEYEQLAQTQKTQEEIEQHSLEDLKIQIIRFTNILYYFAGMSIRYETQLTRHLIEEFYPEIVISKFIQKQGAPLRIIIRKFLIRLLKATETRETERA